MKYVMYEITLFEIMYEIKMFEHVSKFVLIYTKTEKYVCVMAFNPSSRIRHLSGSHES